MRRLGLVLVSTLLAVIGAVPAHASTHVAVARPLPPVEPPPTVTAESWILYDESWGAVLGSFDADEPRAMASTTKIMTGLVAIENLTPGLEVEISERAAGVGEAEVGLVPGEVLPVDQLITALLVRSANDAALAVAEAIGGSVEGFVRMMNDRAAELGLEQTSFANPHGLDADGHHTSARDLLRLTVAAMETPTFAERVATRRFRLPDAPDGTERIAEATNRLLFDDPGAIGVKTGFTARAGLVLVAAAERDGRMLYAVVMGSDPPGGHFADATALLDHGFEDFRMLELVMEGSSTPDPLDGLDTGQGALAREAAAHALVHLGAAGLLGIEAPETEPVEEPESEPPPTATTTPPLPGPGEVLRWFFGEDSDGG